MLIKAYGGQLINLDNITGLFNNGKGLVCYIPSSDPEKPYQEFYLGVSNQSSRLVINQICNLYKQTIVTETGSMIVPNQVYEIPASILNSVNYFTASQITVDRSNEKSSQKLLTGNRLYADMILKYNGTTLRENIDYTAIYPLYRGKNKLHTIIYTTVQSKTMLYVSFYASYPSSGASLLSALSS